MTIEQLKMVLAEQRDEILDLFNNQKIVKREVDVAKLLSYLSAPNVLVITGPRRCGKSVLSKLILHGKNFGYINFDDERLAGFKTEDFNLLLQAFYELQGRDLEYFIFDEIQDVSDWQLFIARLRQTKKIIITGSNAKLLSGELATHLTGRHISFTLYPYSFVEFLRARAVPLPQNESDYLSTASVARYRTELSEYIRLGGFPEALLFGSEIVKNIYGDIIDKDILYRHEVRHKSAFRELARYLLSLSGQKIGYAKLKKISALKHVNTVRNYVEYLSSAYLIFQVDKFSYKLKQQYISPRKIYCADTGLFNALAFQFSQNAGVLMETVVYLELLRRRSYHGTAHELYYWQDESDREVDFVVMNGRSSNFLIQVCYDFEVPEVKERELRPLLTAADEFKCGNLLVITDNYFGQEKFGNKVVKYLPLWRWLLENK